MNGQVKLVVTGVDVHSVTGASSWVKPAAEEGELRRDSCET